MHKPAEGERPTAFVSYAQSSKPWQHEVLRFTTALRTIGGIDAELDLFHASDHQQWTTFGSRLIAESDFTLIAPDKAYRRRWLGKEEAGVGAGAAWEAAAVKASFERDQDAFVRRVKVVVLPSAEIDDIPDELRGLCERFEVDSFDEQGLELLLRSLWGRPAYPKPPLGEIPTLPPKAIGFLEQDDSAGSSRGAGFEQDDSQGEAALERKKQQVEESLAQGGKPSDRDELSRKLVAIEVSLEALSEAQERPAKSEDSGAQIPEHLRPLVQALGDPDGMVRFNAMSALGDRLGPELLPVIKPLLNDNDSYIRQMAVEYYGQLTGQEGAPQLMEALGDPDNMVRFNAMSALGERLTPDLLPMVESLLEDEDAYIRQMAVDYYAQLAGRGATARLVQALGDPDGMVRFNAMSALGDRLGPELLPVIKPLLNDNDSYIRQMAVEYYAALTGAG